jgi:hypothetical protein
VVTRRGLLAASAALLAGCGSDDAGPEQRASERPGGISSLADVALLNDALALERRAGNARSAALLERLIRRARGAVHPLDPGAAPPDPVAAQDELVALYVDYLPKLSEPRLRAEVGGLLAAAARRGAELRERAGREPAPAALFDGARPEEVRG